MDALVRFTTDAAQVEGDTFTRRDEKLFALFNRHTSTETLLTTERELSLQQESVQLLGLDHPQVVTYLRKYRELPPEELGLSVQSPDGQEGILTAWAVESRGNKGQVKRLVAVLAVDIDGRRLASWERQPEMLWRLQPTGVSQVQVEKKLAVLHETLEPMLQRELEYRGLVLTHGGFEAKLIGWVEVVA